MTDRSEADKWWQSLPAETRDNLDDTARKSVIDGLVGYPYWDRSICAELLAWVTLDGDVSGAHADWLAKLKHHVESRGREWNRGEFLRICHLEDVSE